MEAVTDVPQDLRSPQPPGPFSVVVQSLVELLHAIMQAQSARVQQHLGGQIREILGKSVDPVEFPLGKVQGR